MYKCSRCLIHRVALTLSLAAMSGGVSSSFANSIPLPNSPGQASSRIVGGVEASAGAYPWMVALVAPGLANSDAQFCGASLIDAEWVMTAAHCVEGNDPSQVEALLGATDLNADEGQRIGVSKVVIHPDYTNQSSPDIALLKLSSKASQTPVELLEDSSNLDAPGSNSRAIGWGATSGGEDGQASPRLLQVDVPIVSHEQCSAAYSAIGIPIDKATMICAGTPEGGKDSCYGDSGGPLILPAQGSAQARQLGIVSFGADCGAPGVPGVYTRTTGLNKWIKATLAGQDADPTPTPQPEPNPEPNPSNPDNFPEGEFPDDEFPDDEFPVDYPDDEIPDDEMVFDPCSDPDLAAEWEAVLDDFCSGFDEVEWDDTEWEVVEWDDSEWDSDWGAENWAEVQ